MTASIPLTGTLLGTSAVPIIVAIIQALKYVGVPANLSPIFAIALGLAAGFASIWATASQPTANSQQLIASLALGLTWGLSASGLYEVGRTALNAQRKTHNPYGPPRPPKQVGQPLGPLPPKAP